MKSIASGIAVVLLSTLAATTALAQANPGVGTWKMNPDKSKFTSMPAPKSLASAVAPSSAWRPAAEPRAMSWQAPS